MPDLLLLGRRCMHANGALRAVATLLPNGDDTVLVGRVFLGMLVLAFPIHHGILGSLLL